MQAELLQGMENEASPNGKIPFDPNAIFRNRKVSYFGSTGNLKIKYKEFVYATGFRKWLNSCVVVFFFLAIEAVVIANYPPVREFVVSFFSLER